MLVAKSNVRLSSWLMSGRVCLLKLEHVNPICLCLPCQVLIVEMFVGIAASRLRDMFSHAMLLASFSSASLMQLQKAGLVALMERGKRANT